MEPLTELLNLSSHAAHWPGLRPIGALLEHLARYIAILPIVIFRAEIRRLLSGLNRALALLRPLEKDSLDEIARAAEYLSQNRIGALIVLERKTKLRTYVGTAIDASLSYDLLI